MPDLQWLADASIQTVLALGAVAVIVLAIVGIKMIDLGQQTVKLLGNHILHRLDRQTDVLKEIRDALRGGR